MMGDGMMHGMYGIGMAWMVLCVLFGIVLLAGIILLLVWAVKAVGKGRNQSDEVALDILKKRYARGEITREEFERMKHEIS